jgi:hypothetical protein
VRQSDGALVPVTLRARFTRLDGTLQWIDSPLGGSTTQAEIERGMGSVSGLPADLLRVTIDVPELGEETFDVDVRKQPVAPIVLRLSGSRGTDFPVLVLVDALVPGTKPADVARMDEAELLRHVVAPDATIEIRALDEGGKELFAATITHTDEKWSTEARFVARDRWTSSTAESPQLSTMLPGRSHTLVIRAAGYVEQRLALDPVKENGGVPRIVLLAR